MLRPNYYEINKEELAYDKGYKAFKANKRPLDNPYTQHRSMTHLSKWWIMGLLAAQEEMESW